MKQVLSIAATLLVIGAFAVAQTSTNPSAGQTATPPSGAGAQSTTGMPGQAPSTQSDEQQLLSLEQQWSNAMKSGDASALARIEADDYVFTDPTGRITSKQDDLNGLQSGQVKIQTADLSNLQVHIVGDTAVVTGQETLKGMDHGKDISGKYAFTDTWVKRNGQWQAVATQANKLPSQQTPQ